MALALVSTELLTVMGMLVLLVAVPLFVIAVLAVLSAYIQYDADRYLEDLEADPNDESIRDDGRR